MHAVSASKRQLLFGAQTARHFEKTSALCKLLAQGVLGCPRPHGIMAGGNLALATAALLVCCSTCWPSVLASFPAVSVNTAGVSAQDFKALTAHAASTSERQLRLGGKRALLQSSGFSQDFFNILEPILVGDTGVIARLASVSA